MLQNVRKKTYPSADELSLSLHGKEKEKRTMKLSKALTKLEPFSYLDEIKAGTEETPGTYKFLKFNDPGLPQNKRKIGPTSTKYYKRKGRGKEVHLNTDCPAGLFRHKIKLAYGFLLEGSRIEFHLRAKAVAGAESVDSALRNHLHLRPDAILAAMPPGTTMLAVPGTAQPPENEMKRAPKRVVNKTSDVFWAMENAEALKRYGVVTPPQIKTLGTWTNHQKAVKTALYNIDQKSIRRHEKLDKLRPDPSDPHPKLSRRPLKLDLKVSDGDLPHLSELMPERERDNGSSGWEARSTPNYIPFHQSGRR